MKKADQSLNHKKNVCDISAGHQVDGSSQVVYCKSITTFISKFFENLPSLDLGGLMIVDT